jgi:hypothetical protein
VAAVTGSKRRHRLERRRPLPRAVRLRVLMLFPFASSRSGRSRRQRRHPLPAPAAALRAGDRRGRRRGAAAVPDRGAGARPRRDVQVGIFARPTTSSDRVRVPTSDAERRGGFLDPRPSRSTARSTTSTTSRSTARTRELIQLGTTTEGIFARPDDPTTPPARTSARPRRSTASPPRPRTTARSSSCRTSTAASPTPLLVTLLVVGGTVLTSILGGYAFARIEFPGRDAIFLVYIGSIMVPFVILIIPLYQLMVALGWIDSLARWCSRSCSTPTARS